MTDIRCAGHAKFSPDGWWRALIEPIPEIELWPKSQEDESDMTPAREQDEEGDAREEEKATGAKARACSGHFVAVGRTRSECSSRIYSRSRTRLEAENLFLRHQLTIALRRAPFRLRLRGSDRMLLIWMTRLWPSLLGAAPGGCVYRKPHPEQFVHHEK